MKTIYKVLNIFMVLSLLFGMWPVTGVIAQGPDEPITPEVTEEAPLVDSDGSLVTDFDDVVIDASDETLQPAESTASPDGEITPQDAETKIAVISDFGVAISDPHKAAIATLITNWAPVAVVTGGDNYHDRTPFVQFLCGVSCRLQQLYCGLYRFCYIRYVFPFLWQP